MSRYQLQLWTVNVLMLQRCNSLHSFGCFLDCLLDSLLSSFSYSWGSLEFHGVYLENFAGVHKSFAEAIS